MRAIKSCAKCGGRNIKYESVYDNVCYCNDCKQETPIQVKYIKTPQERTRDYVYATGNRWAIENFNATH